MFLIKLHVMGNEGSQLCGLEIEDKACETTDFWRHYQATIKDSCRYFSLKGDDSVSIFKGESVPGPLWTLSTPLEKFSNNLLKYRHPCIIRYISAWQQKSTFFLATEYVQPVAHVLQTLTPLQICIGLNNILRALVFLHEQAKMSHNNVCLAAVYVTGDGQWKLGGLQYLCSFTEVTSIYLKQARIHRYDKAIDPNEDSYQNNTKVDQYSFAVLVDDVYKGRKDDEVPHLNEFKKYCHQSLQDSDPIKRPNLTEVLQHNFFNHEFITIYKFLNFLPIKTEEEKCEFFTNILDNLKFYDEHTVAKQLTGLLLSRVTMLDQTARKDVIPFILKPRNKRTQNGDNTGFFSLGVFKEYIKPRLLQLFGVMDSQIRMLLLTHFTKFVNVFSHEELSQHILPELLLGMKDTDDNLVASTLICLSELVPILGADTVIGGKRSKLFTDGRPKSKINILTSVNNEIVFKKNNSELDFPCSGGMYQTINGNLSLEKSMTMNERPSPVGGESVETEMVIQPDTKITAKNDDDWNNWDNNNVTSMSHEIGTKTAKPVMDTVLLQNAALKAKKNILDISELDIKNQKSEATKNNGDEFDFFADMAPVIEKPTIVDVTSTNVPDLSKFNFVPDENDGWGDSWNE